MEFTMLTQTRNDRHAAIGTSMKTKTGRCSRVPHAPTQLINKVHYSGFNSLLHQMIYMDGQQNTYTSFINFLTVTFQALQLFLKKNDSKILKQPAKTTKMKMSSKICMQGKRRRAHSNRAPRKQNSVSLTCT